MSTSIKAKTISTLFGITALLISMEAACGDEGLCEEALSRINDCKQRAARNNWQTHVIGTCQAEVGGCQVTYELKCDSFNMHPFKANPKPADPGCGPTSGGTNR